MNLIRKEPVQPRAVESVSPTFFRGLLLAFPLMTAMWIAVFLMVRADI
jgi:hypothetical protein